MAASLSASPARARRKAPLAVWAALVLAVGVALAAGAGAFSPGRPNHLSLYQRTQQLAGQYRCPVCQGESVAVSDASAADEIRNEISSWLKAGRSPDQIRSYLVGAYGSSILENPPAQGAGLVVWVLPILAAGLALGGLGWGFTRWRRAASSLAPASGPAVLTSASGAPALLAPVPARDPVLGRTAAEAVAEPPVPPDAARGSAARRPRRSSWAQRAEVVGGGALVVTALALWLVDRTASTAPAAPSQPASSISSELEQAAALVPKNPLAALVLYQQVLRADPDEPIALSSEGWLYTQTGWVALGLSSLAQAEKADPQYAPPHLYRGLALLDDARQPKAALTELAWYLSHGPAKAEVPVARQALAQAMGQFAVL